MLSTAYKHFTEANETSCFFAHPKVCTDSDYSRRERFAITVHILLLALLSEWIVHKYFKEVDSFFSSWCLEKIDIHHKNGMQVLKMAAGVVILQFAKILVFTDAIKAVFALDNSKGICSVRMIKWFVTIMCFFIWLVGVCVLISLTVVFS